VVRDRGGVGVLRRRAGTGARGGSWSAAATTEDLRARGAERLRAWVWGVRGAG
jgi:hypothetical protein